MKFIIYLSDYIMPFIIFYIIGLGLLTKTPIYDEFIKVAKEGFKVVIDILPTLIGLMVAIGILKPQGALDILSNLLKPFYRKTSFSFRACTYCFS